MKGLKKKMAALTAAALCLTSMPLDGVQIVSAATSIDSTVKLKPTEASIFNDTNGDGLGEFEGWGTSLCWWANRIGYSDKLTEEAAKLFFSPEGLDMNIGRYNVGGGDDTGETTTEKVPVNEKAKFYDLTAGTYSYAGSSGKAETYSKMADMTYSKSDADFGFTKGEKVGSFTKLGWINKLSDTAGSGDNLKYQVNVDESGAYTVKVLMTLEGTNSRDVALGVTAGSTTAQSVVQEEQPAAEVQNEEDAQEADTQAADVEETADAEAEVAEEAVESQEEITQVAVQAAAEDEYVADAATVNNSLIAEGTNNGSHCMLFAVTFSNVKLQAGENTIRVAGKSDWTLDFVKMAVVKAGDEGVVPDTDEFKHAEHIVRSDAGVPGYATDVTKIDTSKHDLSWYTENFARADESCGYAWNYDWDADKNQMNVLKAAAKASGQDFIAEAFSNSPPYFMTVSGCSSGNTDSSKDNLRTDSVNAFAAYMADVIEHWDNEGVINFQSVDPMNEPYTNYWGANSNKQEGCHFDQGESQSRILVALNKELKNKGINMIISGTDETSIDTQISSYNNLSDEAKNVISRIDTHTYSGSNREGLKETAQNAGKNLWMSEVDGAYTAGTNAGEMTAALGLAQRMMTDVNGLESSAWILWNAIDMHADSSETGQAWVNKGSNNDYLSMDALESKWKSKSSNGYWGLAAADHDNEEIALSMKYYAYGQFSRYIRPGYTIIGTSKGTTLAAYDPDENKAVVVAMNTSDADKTWKFDLSGFNTMGDKVTAIRTSGSLDSGEHWADVSSQDDIVTDTENRNFTATLKANSITTYIIEGVSGIKDATQEEVPEVEQVTVEKDQVSSSTPWNNSTTNIAANVVDGKYSTFFDGVSNGYVTLDLKEMTEIGAIAYAPRSGYAGRCVGATIYGSEDGENWTELYTIEETPSEGKDTIVYYTDFNVNEAPTCRYIKYAVGANGNCNLSELKIYRLLHTTTKNLTAHYDMSVADGKLTDVSGKGNDATLHDITEASVATYGEESVLHFNKDGYADIPAGLVGADGQFTVQATFSTQTQANHWLWCFGRTVASWPNVDHYVFVGVNSDQNNYKGNVLAAISSNGEVRMDAPAEKPGAGYTTVTITSDGTKLSMYMDGVLVSEKTHGKDVTDAMPSEGELGYIGKSLYNGDPLLKANVSDIRIWNTALTADQVQAETPDETEKTNMLLADIQTAMLNGNSSTDEVVTDLAFPTSMDGYDLTWNVPENDAIAQNGKVTPPAEDVNVTITVSYGDGKSTEFAVKAPGENIGSTLQKAYDELDIPNKDDVRGNITLPETTESGVTITWATDHPEIVDVASHENEGYDPTPAGTVTRPQEDTTVTMTATLSYKGETLTKEIVIQVKAKAAAIQDDDYTDYFFAYFAGEGYSDGEQIYFASSQDGLNWSDLNDNNPILTSTMGEKGVRDPFIIRSPEGDKFYLIATDLKINGGNGWDAAQNSGSQSLMIWESTDLVNWSEQRMVEVSAKIEAGCTWAPEATYDPQTGEYVVYWASRTPNKDTKQRLYYAKTRDFYSFTEPQLWIDYDQSSIDTTMIEENGTYYRFTKNEGGSTNSLGAKTKTIFLEKSNQVLGTYAQIASESLNGNQYVEGPTIFKLNSDDADTNTWCLLVDDFGGGGYYPLLTTDLESGVFTKPEAGTYKMPSRARHGTPIRITKAEYQAVMAAYGTPDKVDTYAIDGTPVLPETVTVGGAETAVTWNLDGVSFEGNPYSYVTVTGTTANGKTATAEVKLLPKDLEYMVDCNNTGSSTWEKVKAAVPGLKNADAADQAKTDDNTWGYTSVVGDSGDIKGFSQSSVSNPYTGGWWARSNKNITYQFTLPAGEHTVMLGNTGWWNMNREMDVYYSVNGENETKLCDFDAVKSAESYAQGTITLEKQAVVTITIKKAASDDPIVSWISVSGQEAPEPEPVDKSELQNLYDANSGKEQGNYTDESWKSFTAALEAAKAVLDNEDATEEQVAAATTALEEAVKGLTEKEPEPVPVDKSELQNLYDANSGKEQGNYTDESWKSFTTALEAAKAVLDNEDATEEQVAATITVLEEAVKGLTEKEPEPVPVDKSGLQKLYDANSGKEQGNYTDESWKSFTTALEAAKAVLDNEVATEEQVAAATTALEEAVKGLTEKEPEPVDKSELQKLYDANSGKEQGNYTDESWKVFETALESAKAVLDNANATEKMVQAAAEALKAAVDGLTEKTVDPEPTPTPSTKVDKTNLSRLYEQYKDMKQGNYTDASYKAFTTALEAAKTVLEAEAPTREEVSKAYSDLNDAVKGLVTKSTQTSGSSQGTTTKPGSSQNGTGTKTSNTAKTADRTPIAATAGVMLAAMLVAVLAWRKKEALKNKER